MNKAETMSFSPYAVFSLANKGYNFKNKRNQKVYTKLEMWIKFQNSARDIDLLLDNSHPEYIRINKPEWEDGELVRIPDYTKMKKQAAYASKKSC